MIFCTCPLCGANLDPGERCDCEDNWMKVELPPPAEADGGADRKDGNYGKAEIRKAENSHV
ncbi:MAG: hypothetical protein HDT27_04750 [Subdoligranulum sp.]|nr:hypothetical protein [Subdoligranulum sp.]